MRTIYFPGKIVCDRSSRMLIQNTQSANCSTLIRVATANTVSHYSACIADALILRIFILRCQQTQVCVFIARTPHGRWLSNSSTLLSRDEPPVLAGCSLGWLLPPPNLPLPRGGAVGGGVFSNRWDRRNAVFSEICLTDREVRQWAKACPGLNDDMSCLSAIRCALPPSSSS